MLSDAQLVVAADTLRRASPAYARREFVANLETARNLGITIPPSILQRVDRVIE